MKKLLLFLLPSVLFTLPACKKEGCIDPEALNYDIEANSDDGSCTYQAQKFIGTYNVTGTKIDQFFDDTTLTSYQIIITHDWGNNIFISNLGGTGYTFNASIRNSQLNIPLQTQNFAESWSGNGLASGNTITMKYNETLQDLFFEETAVKQ